MCVYIYIYVYMWLFLVLNWFTWYWFGFHSVPWVFSVLWSRNIGLLFGSGIIASFLEFYAIVRVLLRVVCQKWWRSQDPGVDGWGFQRLWILIAHIGGRAMSREPWHILGTRRRAVWGFPWCIILTRTLAWARERKDGVIHYSRYVYRLDHFVFDMCWYSNVVEYIWLLIMFPCCFDHHWCGML